MTNHEASGDQTAPAFGPSPTLVPSDEQLAVRVSRRDDAAFEQLYNRYVRTVYVIAVHALGNAEAEEVVQDVFLRLWRKSGQFDASRGSFAAWLMTIARNRVLDSLRKRSQQQRLAFAGEAEEILAEALDSGVDVEFEAAASADRRALIEALRQLPAEQRRAIMLAYFSGLTHTAISNALGWPEGTVKKRIRLGMQKLRAALNPVASDAAINSGSKQPRG